MPPRFHNPQAADAGGAGESRGNAGNDSAERGHRAHRRHHRGSRAGAGYCKEHASRSRRFWRSGMPLVIDCGPVPTFWASKDSLLEAGSGNGHGTRSECVRVAFINNMPDPALEDTEQQFFELLDSAAVDVSVSVKLYSLPGIPRGDRGQERS